MKAIPRVLILHDVCGVGKAAAMNMIPVLNVMGVEVSFLPTVLLSTHTGGYGKPAMEFITADYIRASVDHYVEQNITFDAIFIGYLGKPETVDAVSYLLSHFSDTTVILDPIMGDNGRLYNHFDKSYLESIKKLLPYADILLPNVTELCLLTDCEYPEVISLDSLREICEKAENLDAKQILITGINKADSQGICIYKDKQLHFLELSMLDITCHGTGDLFDGVFVGSYLKNKDLSKAAQVAHNFVYACLSDSQQSGFIEREGLLFEKNLNLLV